MEENVSVVEIRGAENISMLLVNIDGFSSLDYQ